MMLDEKPGTLFWSEFDSLFDYNMVSEKVWKVIALKMFGLPPEWAPDAHDFV